MKLNKPDRKLELELRAGGVEFVIGIDEAGRGPWAGPVASGAAYIPLEHNVIDRVCDSKLLNTDKKREAVFDLIKSSDIVYGCGLVSSKDIDQLGIAEAVRKAMSIALKEVEKQIGAKAEHLLIDGPTVHNIEGYRCDRMAKGDRKHYCISVASIVAKVMRDRYMVELASEYPQYKFEQHKGYGTAFHKAAIETHGVCTEHRQSFKPIRSALAKG